MSGNPGMERLIPLINSLQDIFALSDCSFDLDLPQIAVIGGQSAGKSSVIENFVGKDFLPKGSGIVTRRPIILQLITSNGPEYAQFTHTGAEKFVDFAEVRREIERETDRVTGMKKGISSIPINLKIFSPHVLNLTLIDLPGMTKVPVGDQPADVEEQIRSMIDGFVSKESCLILAISPANNDIANSDALKVAKEHDPKGFRTIGVLTKLDLMDEGTDAKSILENKHLPLRRGYVGVINRSQKDINGNKNIVEALKDENYFFSNHPAYKHMSDRLGSKHLQIVLNTQLKKHIQDSLPNLRVVLQKRVKEIEEELGGDDIIDPNEDSNTQKSRLILKFVQQLVDEFSQRLLGTEAGIHQRELSCGARINQIFHFHLPKSMKEVGNGIFGRVQSLKEDENKSSELVGLHEHILLVIRNTHAITPGLFTPNRVFEQITKSQIHLLVTPAMECVSKVTKQLRHTIRHCNEHMAGYPALQEISEEILLDYLRDQEMKANEMLKFFIDEVQPAYINTCSVTFDEKTRNAAAQAGCIRDISSVVNSDSIQLPLPDMLTP